MPEIIKTYKQEIPARRFIGKKYNDNDRVNGTFGKHWTDWFQNRWSLNISLNELLTCPDGLIS
jgi:hypothetical protein